MRCWDARQSVSDYMDDDLTARERGLLEKHLESCPTCPPLYAGLVGVREVLGARRDTDAAIPDAMADRIRNLHDAVVPPSQHPCKAEPGTDIYPPGYTFSRSTNDKRSKAWPLLTLTEANFENIAIREGIVLVDFWAAWCGPCRMFAPVFEKASEAHADITFGKVDTEAEQVLAASAHITSIPTLMAFRDGILVYREAGALPAPALEDTRHVSTGPGHGRHPRPRR